MSGATVVERTECPVARRSCSRGDWLRAHLSEPIDLKTLAEAAGVRPRTLETHFTVTSVALASGFKELGVASARPRSRSRAR